MMIKNNKIKSLAVFAGLNKKEIVALYNDVPVINLQAGQTFCEKTRDRHTIYMILIGEIRIVDVTNDMNEDVAALPEGTCFRQALQNIMIIANVASTIMVIDRKIFSELSEKIHLFVFKKLNDFHFDYLDKLSKRNRQLSNDLFTVRDNTNEDYSKSELILSIINKVPRLPVSATTLAAKLIADNISLKDASHMVMDDPSLAGSILKTINSSYYGFEKKISDIHQAIVYLGFNSIYQMIMAESTRKILSINPTFQDLYFHSVAISNIAFAISEISKTERAAQISTICLLHDFGQNVIELLKKQNPKLTILIDAIASDQLGALLLRRWNLPDVVWQSIQFQSYPQFSDPSNIPRQIRNSVTILYFSHLCYEIFQGKSECDLPVTFLHEYKRLLKWENLSLNKIAHDLVLKTICKKINTYPKSFRDIIEKYLRTRRSISK